jgi:hypothetical protein
MDHSVSKSDPLLAQSSVLYSLAWQYQRMAAAVGTIPDMRALDNLAKGYTVLAEQRKAVERPAPPLSPRSATIKRKSGLRCPCHINGMEHDHGPTGGEDLMAHRRR